MELAQVGFHVNKMKRYRYEILSGFTGTTSFQVPIYLEASVDEMGIMSGFDSEFEQIEQFANFTYKSGPFPSPTPSPSITPTRTPTATPSISVSAAPGTSVTPTPSITKTPSVTPSITKTPSVTPSISTSPPVTSYSHRRSNTPNSVECSLCPISFGSGFFYTSPSDNIPTIGMTVYQDSGLTTPFNGGNMWWGIEWDGPSASSVDLIEVSATGEVLDFGICSVDCP